MPNLENNTRKDLHLLLDHIPEKRFRQHVTICDHC